MRPGGVPPRDVVLYARSTDIWPGAPGGAAAGAYSPLDGWGVGPRSGVWPDNRRNGRLNRRR